MRLLRGGTLRQRLKRGNWSIQDTTRILYQIGSALSHAHRFGAIHRDIKPENILLDNDGNAYLADFGIAEIIHEVRDADEQFSMFGSPAYVAPEQILGRPATPQTDIYSLGIILYEMLTGEHPFPELSTLTGTGVVKLRTTERLPHLKRKRPDLPLALDECIQQATALHPDDCFPDALSFANTFRAALGYAEQDNIDSWVGTITVETGDTPNPYKGLRAFQESDTHYFYGRDRLVKQLVNQLEMTNPMPRFLAVVGPSGSGKSSVVKAGLVPSLRRGAIQGSENWFFAEMVPGTDPLKELANTLNSVAITSVGDISEQLKASPAGLLQVIASILPPNTELLLFIDQFEEVFTLVENEAETAHILESLNLAVNAPDSCLRVVITLRADFYDRPLLNIALSDLMQYNTEIVIPMTPQELEQAIIEPARQVGIMYDRGVVAAIVAELSEQPGALPLLQYALSEMFEVRHGQSISLDVYEEIGGVRGALAQRADGIFQNFTSEQQELTRQLFLRLITLGEGSEDTRRRVMVTEVTAMTKNHQIMDDILRILGNSRLLTFDYEQETRQPTVEVTHEAIIREWKRLRSWLDESRNDIRMQRSLASFAAEWNDNHRDASYLLRGARLEQYEKWAEQTNLALTSRERNYLTASITERHERDASEKARQQRETQLERQSLNRLRLLAVVLLIAFLIAAGLTFFALNESRVADDERDRAEFARATSDANTLLARSLALEASAQRALDNHDSDLGIILAVAANQIPNPPIQAQSTLAEAALSAGTRRIFTGHRAEVTAVDISPDEQTLISSSLDGTVRLWDVASGREIQWDMETGERVLVGGMPLQTQTQNPDVRPSRPMLGHNGDVDSVVFSLDGRLAVSGAKDFTAIIWDVETGTVFKRLVGHQENVSKVTFSPDGRYVLTGSKDTTLILWDAETGAMIRQFVGHRSRITSLAFTPDGNRILSSGINAILWDVVTGEMIWEFQTLSSIKSVGISPDGLTAVTASADGVVDLWNLETGTSIKTFTLEIGTLETIAFHPDGSTLIVGTVEGEIVMVDLSTGRETDILAEHQNTVMDISLTDDGNFAASASKDQTIRLWNIGSFSKITAVPAHGGRVNNMYVGQNVLYSASIDGSLSEIRVANSTTMPDPSDIETYAIGDPIMAMAVSPNEQTALLGLRNGDLVIWDLVNHQATFTLSEHTDSILAVSILKNGEQALTASRDNQIILWSLKTNKPIQRFSNASESIFSMVVTPDEQNILAGTGSGDMILWDIQTGQEIRRFSGHTSSVYSVDVSPDGRMAVSGGRDNLVIVWDMGTGSEVTRFTEHTEPVWAVQFSVDGGRAASGSVDGTIILWDIEQRGKLQIFTSGDTPFALAFSPDGMTLISGQETGALVWWQIFTQENLNSWVQQNRYLREFTCVERDLYLIEPYCQE